MWLVWDLGCIFLRLKHITVIQISSMKCSWFYKFVLVFIYNYILLYWSVLCRLFGNGYLEIWMLVLFTKPVLFLIINDKWCSILSVVDLVQATTKVITKWKGLLKYYLSDIDEEVWVFVLLTNTCMHLFNQYISFLHHQIWLIVKCPSLLSFFRHSAFF